MDRRGASWLAAGNGWAPSGPAGPSWIYWYGTKYHAVLQNIPSSE